MANEIRSLYDSSTTLTITLASLATSATAGRQSTMVDNSGNKYQKIHIFAKVTTGTSPTASKSIKMYLLKGDDPASSNYRTDGAGASDAALTIANANLIAAAATSSTSNTAYYLEAVVYDPGPEWGVAILHDTAVNLNSTGGNHFIRFVGDNPEVN